jgi:inner membrane protein
VDPVNVYSQADRASKYGLLFVLLTFVGFFMFELIKQLPIHPIQYGLVGLALAIFFLLLLSLSEHIAFAWAYLVASMACIGLLGFYLSHVLRSRARGLGFAAMLATLYAALYGLLVSEDNALVLGSGLLFLILAAIMVVTRKVDWYELGRGRADSAR